MSDRATLHAEAKQAIEDRNWASAVGICVKLRADFPTFEPGYNMAIIALRGLGLYDLSDDLARAAMKQFGIQMRHLRTMADTAMDKRDFPVALARWAELRARFPERPEGYYRAVAALLSWGHHAEASYLAQLGQSLLPDESTVYLAQVDCMVHVDDLEGAQILLEDLRTRFPDSDRVFTKSLTVLRRRKDVHGALPVARMAFERFGTETFAQEYYRSLLSVAPPTQELITTARDIYEHDLRVPAAKGAHRLFDLAKDDPDLAKILSGEQLAYPTLPTDRPIRAVFYFPTVTQTDNLMPLVYKMAKDARFDPVVLCSRNKSQASDDSFTFHNALFEGTGVEVIDGGDHVNGNISLYEAKADIVFYHTPYANGPKFPFFLKADFVARHARVMHVNYGYFLLTMGAKASHIYDNNQVRMADMVFTEGGFSHEFYQSSFPEDQLHQTGYPKFDAFRDHLTLAPYAERVAGKDKLDVIWTPHWQMREDPTGGTHTSNFLTYLDVMLDLAAQDNIRLHVRPHPLLRARLPSLGLMSYEDYDATMTRFKELGAVVHAANEGVSYIPALMEADVLISDFSSLIPEFFITERPIIFCRTDDVWNNGKWIGEFGKTLITEGCYAVSNKAALTRMLDTIIQERTHPKEQKMRDLIATHNLFPEGSACQRICDAIAARVHAD